MFTSRKSAIRTTIVGAVVAGGLATAVGFGVQAATAGTLPACEASQVNVTVTGTDAAAGNREVAYQVMNTSEQVCVVHSAPTTVNQTNGQDTTTSIGNTYFTRNGADAMIKLVPGASAEGRIGWSTPTGDTPSQDPYSLGIVLPDIGQLDTGYRDSAGAASDHYTVTNLTPAA